MQIDYGITKKQKLLLLGDFNINYRQPNERNKMNTNLVPYGLSVVSKTSTRGKNLIDFVVKDDEQPYSNVFTFESPIKSDHKSIAMKTNVTMNKKQPPRRIIKFDKSEHCKNLYLQDLKQIDWDVLYTASDAEDMYRIFKKILTEVIRYHATLKTVFIRTGKSKIKLESNDFIKSIFKKADSKKTKWNIMNDSRNSTKFSQNIFYLKNCFDDVITDNYKMAQLLNYKFAKLGDYIGSACNFFSTNHRTSKNSFDFRFVTKKRSLTDSNKPSGPSDISSWAHKDWFLFLADPIKLLFNQFLAKEKFPEDLK